MRWCKRCVFCSGSLKQCHSWTSAEVFLLKVLIIYFVCVVVALLTHNSLAVFSAALRSYLFPPVRIKQFVWFCCAVLQLLNSLVKDAALADVLFELGSSFNERDID